MERNIEKALSSFKPPVPVEYHHTKTLVHPDDVPFASPSDCPDVFTAFRKVVESLGDNMVRPNEETIPDSPLKPFPPMDIQLAFASPLSGSLETALEYLLNPLPSCPYDELSDERASLFKGGETTGLARLAYYTSGKSAPIATYKQTRNGMLGDDHSTKFSPWLACGALSPRKVWAAIDKWDDEWTEKGRGTKDSYWIRFELLWRDYFVFIALKYGDNIFKLGGVQALRNRHYSLTEWKKAITELEKKDGMLQRWMEGSTGVPYVGWSISSASLKSGERICRSRSLCCIVA